MFPGRLRTMVSGLYPSSRTSGEHAWGVSWNAYLARGARKISLVRCRRCRIGMVALLFRVVHNARFAQRPYCFVVEKVLLILVVAS